MSEESCAGIAASRCLKRIRHWDKRKYIKLKKCRPACNRLHEPVPENGHQATRIERRAEERARPQRKEPEHGSLLTLPIEMLMFLSETGRFDIRFTETMEGYQ